VHNLLLVDFPCGKSLPAAGKLGYFQCWLFFYYFSLITSQQNHAQARWQQLKLNMEKTTIHKYIFLGTALRYLQDCQSGWPIKATAESRGMYVLENIELFLEELDDLKLFVTKRASIDLKIFLEKINKIDDNNLSNRDALELNKIMTEIRPTFKAECEGIYAFYTSDKRFTIQKLTENIDSLFAPKVFNKISKIAIHDYSEAGFCIAFERPTAAAFHILRATEDILRDYYKKFFREKIVIKNWGQLTNELRNKKTGKKPDDHVVNQLIHIKNSFRNPTQHPEKIYDIHEVQDLLSLSIDIVNRMCLVL
jgi:hypothetical protein